MLHELAHGCVGILQMLDGHSRRYRDNYESPYTREAWAWHSWLFCKVLLELLTHHDKELGEGLKSAYKALKVRYRKPRTDRGKSKDVPWLMAARPKGE